MGKQKQEHLLLETKLTRPLGETKHSYHTIRQVPSLVFT